MYVNELKITKSVNYNSQTNAAGDTVVDYINKKRQIEVGIIPINDTEMKEIQTAIDAFNVSVSFLNPETNLLETINCIIADNDIEFYTIQQGNISYKACTLIFTQL